ncbi:hypothetical protein H072_5993 [Dactylellina haptotyla CBS 200.50]|uniref:Uncharacterized protein n=1 Tax=Dactylellina haptotyla (strain CBS 200.50) TaxID=1284197 RepID=S8BXZ5_DACHA|nr:hypothetical protein H072_5993 [Dactylellina haptotyla CBS 200.50]
MVFANWIRSSVLGLLSIVSIPIHGFVNEPGSLGCDKLLNFRDAPFGFLVNDTIESTIYQKFYWDIRWRPYNCPTIFPYNACFLRNDSITSSCLQNTICSYERDALPKGRWNWTSPGLNFTRVEPYSPRALYYRSDQNNELDKRTGKWVPPRYRFTSVSIDSFAIYSITLAWPAQADWVRRETPGDTSQRAKSIVIRGYGNGMDEADGPKDVIVLNITHPQVGISRTTIESVQSGTPTELPQTPTIAAKGTLQTFLPPAKIWGGLPGVADPLIFWRYEFPRNKSFTQWGNLVALEISGSRYYLDENEEPVRADKRVFSGEFFLKELNITTGIFSGGCATEEQV